MIHICRNCSWQSAQHWAIHSCRRNYFSSQWSVQP